MTGTLDHAYWIEELGSILVAMIDLLARPEMDYVVWGHLLGDHALYDALEDIGVPSGVTSLLERASDLSLEADTDALVGLAPAFRQEVAKWRGAAPEGRVSRQAQTEVLRTTRWLWVGWLDIARPLPPALRRRIFALVCELRDGIPGNAGWFSPVARAAPMRYAATGTQGTMKCALARIRGKRAEVCMTLAPQFARRSKLPHLTSPPREPGQIATSLQATLPTAVDSLTLLVNCKVADRSSLHMGRPFAVQEVGGVFALGGPECESEWLYDEWLYLCEYLFDVLQLR